MIDPVGVAGSGAPFGHAVKPPDAAADTAVSFKQILQQEIATVNELQQDARRAVEAFAAGRGSDVETVLKATERADAAFRMLMRVRSHVVGAFNEVSAHEGAE